MLNELLRPIAARARFALTAQDGQGLVEYSLIILLIAIVVVSVVAVMGVNLQGEYNLVNDRIPH